MSELHLDSLEIKNFRCFEHLVIEKLGRVNLIVGKNSVGKTCLLEALLIYATKASFPIIHKILSDRKEFNFRENTPIFFSNVATPYGFDFSNPVTLARLIKSLRYLFFGRELSINQTVASISSRYAGVDFGVRVGIPLKPFTEEPVDVNNSSLLDKLLRESIQLHWHVSLNKTQDAEITIISLFPEEQLEIVFLNNLLENHVLFIPHEGLAVRQMETFWSRIALTEAENDVIKAMKFINVDIERLGFMVDNQASAGHYPFVKMKNAQEPIPLGQLGDGANRAFGIVLALLNTSNGILLIDEFETGLYHRVQPDIWRAVFKLAHEWNVQVFATTHSWDCVEAFQKAAAEAQDEEAMVIRLQPNKATGKIRAVSYDKEELSIVTEQQIEVR
jgi:ABC-type Mn2+/Zn2+ transport system ATPase subunit